jgi:tetrahedral aminopeptidase
MMPPSKKAEMSPEQKPLRIRAQQLNLLERLCNASAVSGDEGEVRKIVLEEIQSLADDLRVDALGNVLASRQGKGQAPRLRVMLAAHMDEVGMMIVSDEGDGIYRFEAVGGLDARQLPGKPVVISKERIPGIIGAKPIHLTTASERKTAIQLDSLRIDTSPSGKKVQVGDRATFATPFTRLGPSVLAKALDNRLGVTSVIELFKNPPQNIDLLAAFTVQEEVGLRGARVAAYAFEPDLAIALDCTPAYDLPIWDGEENTVYNTRLGDGPAIYVADSSTLSDPRLFRHFIETAETLGLPYQIRQAGGGSTDAGAIHRQRAGIPSISISVPGRHLHSATSIARVHDWESTLQLVHAGLSRLSPDLLYQER